MSERCLERQTGRTVRYTLANYLARSGARRLVSPGRAIAHVRTALPDLDYSDGRLTDMIAGAVIIADLDIIWDEGRGQPLYGRQSGGPVR